MEVIPLGYPLKEIQIEIKWDEKMYCFASDLYDKPRKVILGKVYYWSQPPTREPFTFELEPVIRLTPRSDLISKKVKIIGVDQEVLNRGWCMGNESVFYVKVLGKRKGEEEEYRISAEYLKEVRRL